MAILSKKKKKKENVHRYAVRGEIKRGDRLLKDSVKNSQSSMTKDSIALLIKRTHQTLPSVSITQKS